MSSNGRYQESHLIADRAAKVDPWIESELSSPERRNYQFIHPLYPLFGSHARGAYVWDVDGNRFIDYNLGYGTVLLGHADPRVTEAVVSEIKRGHCLAPLWKPQQAALAELICSVVPNAEMAFFMKTGSDATSGAIRLARLFTGREKIVRWGYNGWHDWCTPRPNGVPAATTDAVYTFPYNDLDAVYYLFREHGSEIACVFMMPFEVAAPKPGFLEGVRAIAHAHGALFILDEMRSGFRFAVGGAQEFLNVEADLVTFSKAMANGFAISCIAGRGDILRGVGGTKMTATYFSSSEGMAAALATINVLLSEDVAGRVWRLGERLIAGLQRSITEEGTPAKALGYPPCPLVEFIGMPLEQIQRAKMIFFAETARQGVLLHPSHHWYVSNAHTEEDIDQTVSICRSAFRKVDQHLYCA